MCMPPLQAFSRQLTTRDGHEPAQWWLMRPHNTRTTTKVSLYQTSLSFVSFVIVASPTA